MEDEFAGISGILYNTTIYVSRRSNEYSTYVRMYEKKIYRAVIQYFLIPGVSYSTASGNKNTVGPTYILVFISNGVHRLKSTKAIERKNINLSLPSTRLKRTSKMARKSGKASSGHLPLTSHERTQYSKGSKYGTTAARLGGASQLSFGHCALSLHPAKEQPVATTSGFVYERAAILEYLLTKTQELKQQQREYERHLQQVLHNEEQEEKKKRKAVSLLLAPSSRA